jgi:hypothetical protein
VHRYSQITPAYAPHCPTGPLVEQPGRAELVEMAERGDGRLSGVVADLVAAPVKVDEGIANASPA